MINKRKHWKVNWKIWTGAIGRAKHLRTPIRRISYEGTGIQSLPAGLCTQASGQPRHSTVRGVTHERGTDPDCHVANQPDE